MATEVEKNPCNIKQNIMLKSESTLKWNSSLSPNAFNSELHLINTVFTQQAWVLFCLWKITLRGGIKYDLDFAGKS